MRFQIRSMRPKHTIKCQHSDARFEPPNNIIQHRDTRAPTPDITGGLGVECPAWAVPQALHAGFVETNRVCVNKFERSGTTATLAVLVGWELIVASVGDSLAFVDTGTEVISVSSNHRVADSPDEVARVIAAGGERA